MPFDAHFNLRCCICYHTVIVCPTKKASVRVGYLTKQAGEHICIIFDGEVSISTFRLLGNEKSPVEKRDLSQLPRHLESPLKVIQNQLTTEKGPETADPRETHLDTIGHPPGVFTAD